MNFNLYTELPIGLSLVCLLIAILLAWFLYRNDRSFKDIAKWKIYSMLAFRFVFIFLISFLLLSPLLKSIRKNIEKPIIILVQDNSESIILNKDSLYYSNDYPDDINDLISKLKDDFEVSEFSFDDGLNKEFNLDFKGKGSNYSASLEAVHNKFINRNVGAVILAGDGLYNKGSGPLIASASIKFPVYTVGLGDTATHQDLKITEINHNKFAFMGNNFPVRVNFEANESQGEELIISLINNGQTIKSESISITSESYSNYIDFSIEAKKKGLQHYTVKITPLDNEVNIANNSNEILIDIIDSKQKIIILHNSPHPDLSAINNALSANINYELSFKNIKDFEGDISKYNLVILHQLPSLSNSCTNILSDILKYEIPVLYILGSQSSVEQFNALNAGVEILQSNNSSVDVIASFDSDFSLFELGDKSVENNYKYPPLVSPFGEYNTSTGADVLAYQQLRGITTNKPLIMFFNNGSHKSGIITGEGIWRWRIQNFISSGNYDQFDEIITKTCQYLSLRIKKERFVVDNKNVFKETETIVFAAEVYNKSYELNNDNEVNLSIISMDDKEYNFVFNKFNNSYRYDAGYFPVGDYSWKASLKYDGDSFSKNGKFTVMPINTESINTTANHQIMYRIANENGGKLYYPNQLDDLYQELKSDNSIVPVIRKQEKLMDMINLKLLFVIILIFMSVEWFMRKFYGGY